MSNLWLVLAMVGTFLTIFLIGVVIDALMRERNRPVALLQSHVGQVTDSVDLRQQELEGSAVDRMIMPSVRRMGRGVVRLTPFDLNARINEQLILAGNPEAWDAERVVALKIIGGMAGVVAGALLMTLLPISGWLKIVFVVMTGLIGYTVPSSQVRAMASKRQRTIQKQLPDVMDLLTISVEAGLGFDAALAQVTKNVPGPLAEEMSRLLQEVQIGVSRADAFRNMSTRTNVAELQSFTLSMIQADLFGVSIANVLRAQSRELRQKRRQRAEEIAQKIPVKLLFPMIFMVLPALFIIVLGPGAIQIYEQFFGSG
ncbi:MAG TPA: type II secretion system F family protein [Actinomycetota bacterium]|nr:type II secretion system F family protein [Actinomycetota bacterium]